MKNLRGIVRNLVIIKLLAVKNRDYNNPEIQQFFNAINELLEESKYISKEIIKALNQEVNECVIELENIRNNEEKSQERKKQINALIENLRQIISQCRRLQTLEELVVEIELAMRIG